MNLKEWALAQGVHPVTAYRWYREGKLPVASAARRLRHMARAVSRKAGPDRRSGQRPSKRWEAARADLARAHARVANLRRRLARAISDCGFGEIRHQLAYKTACSGGRLLVADRFYPSSKTCSACHTVKPKLSLAQRTFTCEHCGMVCDRDVNAARNLAQLVVAGSGPETVNRRGADRKTRPGGPVAVKRQPGTAPAGQTGTVPPQGGTVDRGHTHAY